MAILHRTSNSLKSVFTALPLFYLLLWLTASCNPHEDAPAKDTIVEKPLLSENVIIVVIDGPRYSETWGDKKYTYIPKTSQHLLPEATFFTNFYNEGFTFTAPGHTAIATGVHQMIDNTGTELPQNPSILQLYLEKTGKAPEKAWLIASKGKLKILVNTEDPAYKNKHIASWDCGIDGQGDGYRKDSLTYKRIIQVLDQHKPNLMFVNFREPDVTAHKGDWEGYLQGIKDSDLYVWKLWNYIQSHPHYANKTALLVTNDHGRHVNGRSDQFISHGDDCEGCRHISLLALGPDFRKGLTVGNRYNQTDITATVGKILGFDVPKSKGRVIAELFN